MTEVRYRDKILNLPDATYVLADVREAFGMPTAILRFAGTELLAVTMPHEPITRLDVQYDLFIPEEEGGGDSGGAVNGGGGGESSGADLEDSAAALRQIVALGGSSLLDILSMPAAGDDYRPESGMASTRSVYGPSTYSPFRGQSSIAREARWLQSPPYTAPVEPYVLADPQQGAVIPPWVVPQSIEDAEAVLKELRAVAIALDARSALSMADMKFEEMDVKPNISSV